MRKPAPVSREHEILEAAARIFTEKGYDAASVQDIADAVGLSKPALYHYVRSKEAILFEVSLRTLQGLVESAEAHAGRGPARERLVGFMEAHARFFERNFWVFSAMLLGLGALSPEHRAETVRWRDRYEACVREIVRDGVEAGEFRPVDPVLAARAVLSVLNWMIRWFRPGGPLRAHEVARVYADLLLGGLAQEGRG